MKTVGQEVVSGLEAVLGRGVTVNMRSGNSAKARKVVGVLVDYDDEFLFVDPNNDAFFAEMAMIPRNVVETIFIIRE